MPPSPSDSKLPGLPGHNPNNIQPWTVQVVTSVTVLAFVSVVLRIWSRHIKAQKLWWDDWMIIFSMVRLPHEEKEAQVCHDPDTDGR